MMASIPQRSHQQRMDALQMANGVRIYRANLKKDIKARKITVTELLQDPPSEIDTMPIGDLLLAIPNLGQMKVNAILRDCRISPSRTVDGITHRQRVELGRILGGK